MAEIAADAGLRHCISEMYFEQHYDHTGATHTFILRAHIALVAGRHMLKGKGMPVAASEGR